MIGAFSQRWLERRAHHYRVIQLAKKQEEALEARRAGRAERSCRTAKGWPTRIHETYQRDALINRRAS
ncbi:MAG TPA: hypothetical protein VKQ09_05810 [Sphingomonas sp.]|nr:hypothetical protein [Sphingomonas sp.]